MRNALVRALEAAARRDPRLILLENFGDLVTFKGEAADDFFEIDLPPLPIRNASPRPVL